MSSNMATLNELRTIYDLADAMDMYEAYIIPKYNEWVSCQQTAEKNKRRTP